jgi:hypothetical protein
MLGLRWSVQSPLPASVLADRIRAEPRYNGWDDYDYTRVLIAEQYPVEVGADGFRLLVPSSRLIGVVCTGRFHAAGEGTRIDLSASPPRSLVVGVSLPVVPLAAVQVVGLWSVNPWLAIGTGVAPACFVILMMAVLFRWNARRVGVGSPISSPDRAAAPLVPNRAMRQTSPDRSFPGFSPLRRGC